jgi:hypothetical protein
MKKVAQLTNPAFKGSPLENLSGEEFFQKLLPSLIGLILLGGVLIFFFYMLIGGIQWITSGGDKAGLESAKGKITNAIVGLVILFTTFAIIKAIEAFFGVDILTLDIGPLKIE